MAVSIGLTLVAEYDAASKLWRASVKRTHGDAAYDHLVGEGGSPDEARGHLLREMILAGLNEEMVFLDVDTKEPE